MGIGQMTDVIIFLKKASVAACLRHNLGVPKGIRTPVTAVKGRCPNR
jgi:hypothetical protein